MTAPWWKKRFCGTESLGIFADKQSTYAFEFNVAVYKSVDHIHFRFWKILVIVLKPFHSNEKNHHEKYFRFLKGDHF